CDPGSGEINNHPFYDFPDILPCWGVYSYRLVLAGKLDLPLDDTDKFLDLAEKLLAFGRHFCGICHVHAAQERCNRVKDIVTGDVVQEVEFFVREHDRVLCSPAIGKIPEDTIYANRMPILVDNNR